MDNLNLAGGNYCVTNSHFAATSGATTTTTTTGSATLIDYAIKGKAYSLTPATSTATATTDANTGVAAKAVGAGYGSVYVFCANTSQAGGKWVQGDVKALDAAGNFVDAPQFPAIPDSLCPYGYLVIKAGSTNTVPWVCGSHNMSGVTGITYTFVPVLTLPATPQVS